MLYKNKVFAIEAAEHYDEGRTGKRPRRKEGTLMDSYAQTERLLIRNLKDAGCGETDIQRFLQLGHEGKQREQLRLLSAHRAALLDQLHVSQRQIDCLDYLVFQMNHGRPY